MVLGHITDDKLESKELPWVQRSTSFPDLIAMIHTERMIEEQAIRLAEEMR